MQAANLGPILNPDQERLGVPGLWGSYLPGLEVEVINHPGFLFPHPCLHPTANFGGVVSSPGFTILREACLQNSSKWEFSFIQQAWKWTSGVRSTRSTRLRIHQGPGGAPVHGTPDVVGVAQPRDDATKDLNC